jgi:hypothetical protein
MKHGHSTRIEGSSPTYNSWRGMLDRVRHRKDYIARGTVVCERWLSFANFLADMGERPSKAMSIERRDNLGHYEPGNCIWAPRLQQNRNRMSSKMQQTDVDQLKAMRQNGFKVRELAELFGICKGHVNQLLAGTRWCSRL